MPPIETPGSELLAGNPSGDANGAPPVQQPVVDAAAPPAVPPVEGDGQGNVAPGPVRFDAFDVPETHLPRVTAKGWKSVADVLDGYGALETLVGLERGDEFAQGRILTRPKGDAKPEEIAEFFGKAASPFIPKDAAGYGIKPPEGVDAAPFEEAGELFRAAELPTFYANRLVAAVEASEKAKIETFVTQSNADVAALQTEWGGEFDAKCELGRRAATAAGLDSGALQRLEIAIGTKAMMTALAEFGKQYAEMPAPKPSGQGQGADQFRMSQDQAKSKIEVLKTDSEFQARYLSPNPKMREQAVKEMEDLHRVAYPDPQG